MSTTTVEAGEYRVDAAASTISFTTRHMFGLGAVRGTFALREARVDVADDPARSSVRAVVDAGSVDTGIEARDRAVSSAVYLDAARHPDIVFVAGGAQGAGEDWVLRGQLTVRGVSAPLDLRVEQVRVDGSQVRVVATTVVDRFAFGITAARGMTGRRLRLRLEVVARR
ncbi:hypothetical protein BLA60_07265 [Actinophytocola xinjiangensis]|uniref:Lipid/polyisoprenoid-binding YceI-like domain-containing protein n=1 Tax=Actinophytocola xinjiangensis TaxID=485602 RepID=A0A7Z0WRL3_9PSEU|nr:YceI family protein [Actinophytocola xinjiangensis]OLF13032.1 hypothetical protein BLA60_07265 [Actinophytocola xinjiangensis]